jgi:hypothetical protein
MALLGCTALLAAGCPSGQRPVRFEDIEFDERGWAGPDLDYTVEPDGTIVLREGMMVRDGFRWGSGEVSFEFLDHRDLVWGVRFLDGFFRRTRWADLHNAQVKLGTREWKFKGGASAERYLLSDIVAELWFWPDPTPASYKMMHCRWDERILGNGIEAVRVEGRRAANIRRGTWNHIRLRVRDGELTWWINGKPPRTGVKPIRIDSRANGRIGFAVQSTEPLRIRRLQFSRVIPDE